METTSISRRRDLLACSLALAAMLLWDASGLDLPLARLFGGPGGFPLRGQALLAGPLHEGARLAAWAFVCALTIGLWWPWGPLRGLEPARRLQLALTPLLAVLLVSGLKSASPTSCPWDLATFGGAARHLPHWPWALAPADGGSGHCFPAGHASTGFAFFGGGFAWRGRSRSAARAWWAGALALGLGLGFAQQLRGAHFMSHTLWSAWLCWASALAVDVGVSRVGVRPLAAVA